jgi:hypothetical protein
MSKKGSSSSSSSRTKYQRGILETLEVALQNELNDDIKEMIYQNVGLKESLNYIKEGIPLDELEYDELALNPNVYPLIKVFRDMWGGIDIEKIKAIEKTINIETYESVNFSLRKKDIPIVRLIRFYRKLSENNDPKVISHLCKIYQEYSIDISSLLLDWKALSNNRGAFSLLKLKKEDEDKLSIAEYKGLDEYKKLVWVNLCRNPEPSIIELVNETLMKGNDKHNQRSIVIKSRKENEIGISRDKKALERLEASHTQKIERIAVEWSMFNQPQIDWFALCADQSLNEESIQLLKERIAFEEKMPGFEVAFYNKNYKHGISWDNLSGNPSPEAVKLVKEQIEREKKFESVEQYIMYQEKEIEKLNTGTILHKEEIIAFANNEKRRFLRDQKLSNRGINTPDYYSYRRTFDKIDWFALCANSSKEAFKLVKDRIDYEKKLKETLYKTKIMWTALSKNKQHDAIDSVIERIKYESLNYHSILLTNKISWSELSKNPAIFVPYSEFLGKPKKQRKRTPTTSYIVD